MEPQKGNALAIASLVLGILAALVCWVPFVGLTAIPVGLVGLLLGAIALTLVVVARRRGLAAATVGCGLSVIAMVLSVVITGTASRKLGEALKDSAKPEPVAQAVPKQPKPQAAAPAQPAQPKAPPAPAPAPEPEPEAVAYPGPARLEHVEVTLTRVVRGKVPLVDPAPFPGTDGRGQSKDDLLSVYLEVRNLDDGKKIDYRNFQGNLFGLDSARLADNLGNQYRGVNFGFSSQPEGHTDSESIYPGKAIGDHLVFELPVAKASSLILELPATSVGLEEGVFRFKIPTSEIRDSGTGR
jgi:hypothetical protein